MRRTGRSDAKDLEDADATTVRYLWPSKRALLVQGSLLVTQAGCAAGAGGAFREIHHGEDAQLDALVDVGHQQPKDVAVRS